MGIFFEFAKLGGEDRWDVASMTKNDFSWDGGFCALLKFSSLFFSQIVLGQLSMLKEQCSALIAERLRRGNGFMQVVIIARLQSLAWRIGPMMRTCMIQVILKW